MLLLLQGRDAKISNVLAENDFITQEGCGLSAAPDLDYTLITQREHENKVDREEEALLMRV